MKFRKLFLVRRPAVALIIFAVAILTTVLSFSLLTKRKVNEHPKLQSLIIHPNAGLSSTRVCCLILTSPGNLVSRAKPIYETWGSRCDRHFFITEPFTGNLTSEERNVTQYLPIAPIEDITVGYDHLTEKSNLAFLFAYENLRDECEWFVKADDDTYLIVENLKWFLNEHNNSEPVTFGYNFKVIVTEGYHSGGASYVLSREALQRFYQAHTNSRSDCRLDGGAEDVEIAKCLRNSGVHPGNSLDEQGRELFHPLPFISHFYGAVPDWLFSYAKNPVRSRYDCCGDRTISFHYMTSDDMYLFDFMLYKMRPIPVVPREQNSKPALERFKWKRRAIQTEPPPEAMIEIST